MFHEYAVDFYNVPTDICLNDELVLETMIKALKNNGAHIISSSRYRCGANSPPGIICMVTIDESFAYCHSYADKNEMALNVFTCGKIDTLSVLDEIMKELNLESTTYHIHKIPRFSRRDFYAKSKE